MSSFFLRGAPITVATVVFATLGFGFRRDELMCDAAALHLSECCPDLPAAELDCNYFKGISGCGGESFPILSVDESDCIRDLECNQIVEAGICERVAERFEADEAATIDDTADVEAVCP